MMKWLEEKLSGHFTIKWPVCATVYGFNAMHVAVNFYTRRWGWVCFHPPMYCFGRLWRWYLYASPNGTPSIATFAIGPGLSHRTKRLAQLRKEILGHGYKDYLYDYDWLLTLNSATDHVVYAREDDNT